MIEHVTAVNGNDQEAASEAIAGCDIMATAVGARILKFIVPNIVAGLRKRWARTDVPLNIIICENLMDANKVMEGMLKDLLTDEEKKHFDEKVGLVEASIGRMVPVQTEEMKDGDPMRVCVERYGFLPVDKAAFKGEIPEITNMVPFEPFDFYIKRKLYVHNMGHATCAYLGGYEGRKYIYQSIDDPEILNIVQNAMLESALALHKKYGVELDGLMLHITDLLGRFLFAILHINFRWVLASECPTAPFVYFSYELSFSECPCDFCEECFPAFVRLYMDIKFQILQDSCPVCPHHGRSRYSECADSHVPHGLGIALALDQCCVSDIPYGFYLP